MHFLKFLKKDSPRDTSFLGCFSRIDKNDVSEKYMLLKKLEDVKNKENIDNELFTQITGLTLREATNFDYELPDLKDFVDKAMVVLPKKDPDESIRMPSKKTGFLYNFYRDLY